MARLKRILDRHASPATILSLIALFAAIGGGSALALSGTNTVDSGDIRNGQVRSPDIRTAAVTGGKVKNNSLRGPDIDESTLGRVPSAATAGSAVNSAALGGEAPAAFRGAANSGYDPYCGPVDSTLIPCVETNLNLARAGQVVLTAAGGQAGYLSTARGVCHFSIDGVVSATPQVKPGESATDNTTDSHQNGFALTMATAVLAPGNHTFALSCNQASGDVDFHDLSITALLVG